jgi:hypothetical protein
LPFAWAGIVGGVSVSMYRATLKAFNTNVYPIFFNGLVAQPSTGKSSAINFTSNAIESVESYLRVCDNESVLIQAPTVEGLFDHISKRESLVGKYYETN